MKPASGRLRHLCVLFCDLCDSTELGGEMEAELYAEMLGVLRSTWREVILKHGGQIVRMQGDGVLAVFGHPEPREDDGRRACEAALELHETIGLLALQTPAPPGTTLALHSGIHAGRVLVLDGGPEVGALDVLGDVPNTAARLSSLAERGEIVVSEETLGAELNFFASDGHETVRLKGRRRALAVCRLRRRVPLQRRYEARAVRGLSPFVGREAELELLQRQLQASGATGLPQCAAVVAGPGLGKTRLVEEFVHAARGPGCTVLHGYCESYLSAEPMQPFLLVLRALCGLPPGLTAADAAALADLAFATLPGVDDALRGELLRLLSLAPPGGTPRRADLGGPVQALTRLVDALSARHPVLLVLDDWQWADELSQRALDGILALRRPVFVLLASRPDGNARAQIPRPATLLELQPLDMAETRRTLDHLLPEADPFVVQEVHRYAGGVPLFIEELCHSMAAQRLAQPLPQPLSSAAWLAGLVDSRVERLPDAQRALVRTAAVIGNVFPGWLFERITGEREDGPALRALAAQDLLFPAEQPGLLRFKHGLTRDIVYDAVGLQERHALHLQVVQALRAHGKPGEAEEQLEMLAYHCAAAGVPAEAAHYAERAGDKALAAFALDRARVQYGAALAALDALAPLDRTGQLRWCAVAERLGVVCVFDPLALVDGVALFERSLALAQAAEDPAAIARARYWLGYIHYAKGQALAAMGHCEQALADAQALGDEALAAQVRATLGQALQCACEYERALGLIDTALDSKRSRGRPGSSIAVGSAFSLACKGAILGDLGRFAHAEACFAEALELLGPSTHQVGSSVRMWYSAMLQWQGRWDEAEQQADRAAQTAEFCKSRQLLAMSRSLWGHAHWMASGRAEGLRALLDGTTWIEERQGALVTSLNYGWLVAGAIAEGREVDARRHARRLFARARERDLLGLAMGCRALARAAAVAGRAAVAERYLGWAERAAARRGSPHEAACNELGRAEVMLALGLPAAPVRPRLDAAAAAFEALDMRWHLQRCEALRRA